MTGQDSELSLLSFFVRKIVRFAHFDEDKRKRINTPTILPK